MDEDLHGLRAGERAPEFFLPPEQNVAATLYERYCGRPLVLLLTDAIAHLDAFAGMASLVPVLALVPGPYGERLPAAVPAIADDGRIRRELVGDRFERVGETMALIFDTRLRLTETLNPAGTTAILHALGRQFDPQPIPWPVEEIAPVLMVPAVFDPGLCERLIAAHEAESAPSGMVRIRDGTKALEVDRAIKARQDHALIDPELVEAVMASLRHNLLPGLRQAFRFRVERLEGFKIAAYDAATGGHFRPHRDNITAETAHRQFAVSINLNGSYQGGALRFPEFGRSEYRPRAGGAITFSGGLLHEVTPVTEGRRYTLLTFAW